MKIKQYLGHDMRDAMRQVRMDLGPDAVLLSTRTLATGVEISAAVDAQALARALPAVPAAAALAQLSVPPAPPAPVRPPAGSGEHQAMSEELRTLRLMLERQLGALAWNDFTRREPLRARVLGELTELGLARDVALAVLGDLPAELNAEQAQHLHLDLVARRIATCEAPLAEGGILALVGAAASGRTSVLAKLALRWLLEHGAESLAIATIDDEHIGAAAQARALADLLGVRSFCFADMAGFNTALDELAKFECLLIDTPGLSALPSTQALAAELRAALPAMRSMLTLPASTQADVLDDTLRRAAGYAPLCCTITRCDEALNFGAVLSALMRTQLPVALISDGPRIPEDLRVARAGQLVARAAELARLGSYRVDEELLAQRYGGEVHAAA